LTSTVFLLLPSSTTKWALAPLLLVWEVKIKERSS
jgi:hypothetical protein